MPTARRRGRVAAPAMELPGGPERVALVCAVGLAVIGLSDLALHARSWSVPMVGLLDEPAHLLTAVLVLAAAVRRASPAFLAWSLIGACAIDLDHVPLFLGYSHLSVHGGRPGTHSLLTLAVLLALAALTRGRARSAFAGLATGVVLHFVRDLATGPGLPLLWPLSSVNVREPYAGYAATLVAVSGVAVARRAAVLRRLGRHRRPDEGAAGRDAEPDRIGCADGARR